MTARQVITGQPMDMWLEALASESLDPGGEAFSALAAASGASLVGAVARQSMKSLGLDYGRARMQQIADEADGTRITVLRLADMNADAFQAFLDAHRMPHETDDGRTARLRVLQESLEVTIDGQLEIARKAVYLMGLADEATRDGNPNAAADGLSAAAALNAATYACLASVQINAFAIIDAGRRADLAETCDSLRERADSLLRVAQDTFMGRLEALQVMPPEGGTPKPAPAAAPADAPPAVAPADVAPEAFVQPPEPVPDEVDENDGSEGSEADPVGADDEDDDDEPEGLTGGVVFPSDWPSDDDATKDEAADPEPPRSSQGDSW